MAMLQHRLVAWVFQGVQSDRRVGFVEMSKAQRDAGIAAGRMQDPLVGYLELKHISRTYIAGDAPPPPPAAAAKNGRTPKPPPPAAELEPIDQA